MTRVPDRPHTATADLDATLNAKAGPNQTVTPGPDELDTSIEMRPSHQGLVVGNIACRAGANVWNPPPLSMPLFTHGVMSQRPATKAIASGASCRLRRAAPI
jgi:hypothetical protein